MRVTWPAVVACALAAAVGCGDNAAAPSVRDAGAIDGAPHGDAAVQRIAACGEVAAIRASVPVELASTLGASDVQAPATCAVVDAPFGVASAGPDRVFEVDGLTPGAAYFVALTSAADLSFYVVTGCSTPTGPAPSECLLFEDASVGAVEHHGFVAPTDHVYVVVDDYASTAPPDGSFTLEVYPQDCAAPTDCAAAAPACVAGKCVACATSFDCMDPARSVCDPTTATCVVGANVCATDDPGEPANDGPAGAIPLVAGDDGIARASGLICSSPATEVDYVAVAVAAAGDSWSVALDWTAPTTLQLAVYDAAGTLYGQSLWQQPAAVELTYLPAGTYFVAITELTAHPDPTGIPYTITASQISSTRCATADDCARSYVNQRFRGRCAAGACVAIAGAATVAAGAVCDSPGDCAAGLDCPAFAYVADAATRSQCQLSCADDAGCTGVGGGFVCTTDLPLNLCVEKCTADEQCPADPAIAPPPGAPWSRLSCDLATGHCT